MAAGLQAPSSVILAFSVDSNGGPAETYGIVQSVSFNTTTERAEAKGADGNTVSIQDYDKREELSLSYLELATPTGDPAIGTVFQYPATTGNYYYLTSINRTETVDGFVTVDITGTAYLGTPITT